uniref:Uncharacterized protein n=1 Tax=Corethron hystrix TaxID=216773 RepID=A0A7S1FW56_9STRA|mmetsp:Transcript_32665/g.75187  ORF Transcript_32665/g.75187 Transcript_32665/m.75187 type:complete len:453 (+) Transcript_32665:138-1496(+)|eukprot:CAMPEP_0113314496 /NCGR_PEP_ID=MMETSP0010_2-20120614/10531_1 /TAXON_ID=216773 ORGANISM="Corethron hystrix, Strain 308" /NCGR_SAMPLE_ID=MMETSP0010_2 /ASSEMBLY_ACC=CAM_ASM_000155 /LENGTH=452 /DNA_ID=CAMNT_0000170789 /DNA_START=33 /DNA_END=1391 /DNA_ORIENTATION=+ /assembly_acc=CAM_ASM_000155
MEPGHDARQRLYDEIGQLRNNSGVGGGNGNVYLNMDMAHQAAGPVYAGSNFNRLLGGLGVGGLGAGALNAGNINTCSLNTGGLHANGSTALPPTLSLASTGSAANQRFVMPRMYESEMIASNNFMNQDSRIHAGLSPSIQLQHQVMCDRYRQMNTHDHLALLSQLETAAANHSQQQSLQQMQYCQLNTLRGEHSRSQGSGAGSSTSSAAAGPFMSRSPSVTTDERIIERKTMEKEDIVVPVVRNIEQKQEKETNELLTNQPVCEIVQAQKPKNVHYFPCRAKGMDIDHNFETAYFTISENTAHGTELHCSHPVCKRGGCKFRFCAFCKSPAARRNFRKRHEHAGDDQNNKLKREKPKSDQVANKRQRSSSAKNSMSRSDPGKTSVASEKSESGTSDTNWDDVLRDRPDSDDDGAMSEWVKKVLSVSNRLKNPKNGQKNSTVSEANPSTDKDA